jgi:hypothetical protein
MNDEIIYTFVRGKGWVADYKDKQPIDLANLQRILTEVRVRYVGPATITVRGVVTI